MMTGFGMGLGAGNDILKQRYACGEISKEQYDQMRRDLRA
jgi:uncharacterized membrane protein